MSDESQYVITAEQYFGSRTLEQLEKDKIRCQYLLDRDSGKLDSKEQGMPWMANARVKSLEAIEVAINNIKKKSEGWKD